MEATVRHPGEGFEVHLSLDRDAPVWIFLRSGLARDGSGSWREGTWTVLTDGVELVRINHHDALVASDGGPVPRDVRIAFAPYARMLIADYQPAIALGEATALFSDHFTLRPATSVAAVQEIGTDWTVLPDYEGGHPLVRFEGEQFHHGSDTDRFALETAGYVLYGASSDRGNAAIAMHVDPALPGWLARQLKSDIPAILALYADRLGPHEDARPELLVGWGGATPGTISLGGSVIGNQIVMRIEGETLLAPSAPTALQARQFIAHEAAHFWLGNLVDYGRPGEAWTSEGGADLMALRAAQLVDPDMAPRLEARTVRDSRRQCLDLAAEGPLASAPERGAQQAFYGCGLLMSLAAEAAARQQGGDIFTFWAGLIDRHGSDGTISAEDWFDHYRAIGGDPVAERSMRALAFERGASDPLLGVIVGDRGLDPGSRTTKDTR